VGCGRRGQLESAVDLPSMFSSASTGLVRLAWDCPSLSIKVASLPSHPSSLRMHFDAWLLSSTQRILEK